MCVPSPSPVEEGRLFLPLCFRRPSPKRFGVVPVEPVDSCILCRTEIKQYSPRTHLTLLRMEYTVTLHQCTASAVASILWMLLQAHDLIHRRFLFCSFSSEGMPSCVAVSSHSAQYIEVQNEPYTPAQLLAVRLLKGQVLYAEGRSDFKPK